MHVPLQQFEGPLDLLLQLIEQEELDITTIALAEVCEAYLAHLRQMEERLPEEVADFLVVAAKLLYLKSLELLPGVEVESEDTTGLAEQLRIFRVFVEAAKGIAERFGATPFMYPSARIAVAIPSFVPPPKLSLAILAGAMESVITMIEPIVRIPQAKIGRVISIEGRIREIRQLVATRTHTTLQDIFHGRSGLDERIVSFLAILELVRREELHVQQASRFAPITIERLAPATA